MAKPSWVKTNPSSGSGNANVAVSSTAEHTGRMARSGVLTWKAATNWSTHASKMVKASEFNG